MWHTAEGNASERPRALRGYGGEHLSAAPDGANPGLGCGNPQAFASLRADEIERRPVADGPVGVILSNRVINLSPDRSAAFREAMRVPGLGGRLAIADVIAAAPAARRENLALRPRGHVIGCALRRSGCVTPGCGTGPSAPEPDEVEAATLRCDR